MLRETVKNLPPSSAENQLKEGLRFTQRVSHEILILQRENSRNVVHGFAASVRQTGRLRMDQNIASHD